MEWNEPIRKTLHQIIINRREKVTHVSHRAGKNRNFLTRFFSGDKPNMTINEADAIARALGFEGVIQFLSFVEEEGYCAKGSD